MVKKPAAEPMSAKDCSDVQLALMVAQVAGALAFQAPAQAQELNGRAVLLECAMRLIERRAQ